MLVLSACHRMHSHLTPPHAPQLVVESFAHCPARTSFSYHHCACSASRSWPRAWPPLPRLISASRLAAAVMPAQRRTLGHCHRRSSFTSCARMGVI
uniref:Uncharacterized protein n=1 Tax=Arundo donax TaxID=35708 RepID=A0A0A9GFN6_ARUDO